MELKDKIVQIISQKTPVTRILQEICNMLHQNVPHYHWVGFYFALADQKKLKLAQFAGKPTEHNIIPFGKGICGQVAESNKTFVVQDVTEQDNYISCGFDVKSEMVVPVFQNEKNIGQIDIDSHDIAPFNQEDEMLLTFVCEEVGKLDLSPILTQHPSGT